jgi:putative ABC transport system substrate-binding protein
MEFPATTPLEIRRDLEVRAKSANSKIDAILILPELLTQSPDGWAIIKDFAAEHGIPIAGPTAFIAQQEKGAVFTYGIDLLETGRLAAPLADKVLKGLPAGTIPVLSPEAYLRINYRRARELGLRVPEGMLRMATEIIR